MCYCWRTGVLCLHRDTYLCISSKPINSFLEFKFSPKSGFFFPPSFFFFLFSPSLLFIWVRSITSVKYHDALTFPFHASISLQIPLSWIHVFFPTNCLSRFIKYNLFCCYLHKKNLKIFLFKCITGYVRVSMLDGTYPNIIMLKSLNLTVAQLDHVLHTSNVNNLHLWLELCCSNVFTYDSLKRSQRKKLWFFKT